MKRTSKASKNNEHRIPTECPHCRSKAFIRYGSKRKRRGSIQVYKCQKCEKRFSTQLLKRHHYPTRMILSALKLHCSGIAPQDIRHKLGIRFNTAPPVRTIENWLKAFQDLMPFTWIRSQALSHFRLSELIKTLRLDHRQVYDFAFHRGKLQFIPGLPGHFHFERVRRFLEDVEARCPRELFVSGTGKARASQEPLGTPKFPAESTVEYAQSALVITGIINALTSGF